MSGWTVLWVLVGIGLVTGGVVVSLPRRKLGPDFEYARVVIRVPLTLI